MMKSIAFPRFPLSGRRPAFRALAASAALGVVLASAGGAQNAPKGGVDADLWAKASADPRLAEVTAKLDAEVKALIAQDPVLEADLRKEMEYIAGLKDQAEIAKALAGVNERYRDLVIKLIDGEMPEEMLMGYADIYIDIYAEYGIALEAAIEGAVVTLTTVPAPEPVPPPPAPQTVVLPPEAFSMRVTADDCAAIATSGVSDFPGGLHVNATAIGSGGCTKHAEKTADVAILPDGATLLTLEADLRVDAAGGGLGAASCSFFAGAGFRNGGGFESPFVGIGTFSFFVLSGVDPSPSRRIALSYDVPVPDLGSVQVAAVTQATATAAFLAGADCHADVSNITASVTTNPG